MSTKPTIYIISGAWQLPTAWPTFASIAKDVGYSVVFNQLPTVGGTSLPLPALPDDVAAVAAVQRNLAKLVNEEEKGRCDSRGVFGGVCG